MDASFSLESLNPVDARISTALRPPAAIPRGLSSYSVFAEFEFEPSDKRVTLEAKIRATDDVRDGRPLDSFSVLTFDGERWQPLRPQVYDPGDDAILVSLSEPTTFALFGPARPGAPRTKPQPKPAHAPEPESPSMTVVPIGETTPIADWPGLGARSGAISWGRAVELRPPALDGVFRLEAGAEIGARLTTSPNPPRTLPQGLAAFTPYVLAELSDPSVELSIQVDLRPTAGSVKPENLSQLAVYACSEESEWERLPDQSFEPEVPRFIGTDTQPRIYVLLGPAAVRTTRQAPDE
jgi:hypothetical protein